jgi:hypothetical protein
MPRSNGTTAGSWHEEGKIGGNENRRIQKVSFRLILPSTSLNVSLSGID